MLPTPGSTAWRREGGVRGGCLAWSSSASQAIQSAGTAASAARAAASSKAALQTSRSHASLTARRAACASASVTVAWRRRASPPSANLIKSDRGPACAGGCLLLQWSDPFMPKWQRTACSS
eukprot:scaffold5937_cov68-Phaeocystis_antarctica.AAC.3